MKQIFDSNYTFHSQASRNIPLKDKGLEIFVFWVHVEYFKITWAYLSKQEALNVMSNCLKFTNNYLFTYM